MTTYYLEVAAPTIGALNDMLRQIGVGSGASVAGRLGFEVHYWSDREKAQEVADALNAGGYEARVETSA